MIHGNLQICAGYHSQVLLFESCPSSEVSCYCFISCIKDLRQLAPRLSQSFAGTLICSAACFFLATVLRAFCIDEMLDALSVIVRLYLTGASKHTL